MPQPERRDLEPNVQDIVNDPITRQIMEKWGVQAEELMALLQEAKNSCERARLSPLQAMPEIVTIN